MIIDATDKFSQRNEQSWYQKLSGTQKHLPSKVIPLHTQPENSSETGSESYSEALTEAEIKHLQNSTSLLITHSDEIADNFYKNVLKTMWWNHDRFQNIVDSEKEHLLSSLLAHAEKPANTARIAFFLADNWIKYRYMSSLGDSYDTITYLLNNAIDDTLGEYFTPGVCVAWRKALAPKHVFNHSLDSCKSKNNNNITHT